MNINNISTSILQYKNLLKYNTNPFVKSNLLPLSYDTISFGAGKQINDVNINQAKKRIAEFQDPNFNPSGQHNLPLGELLNVCKYCGCTIETDGGAHQYHLRTPLGQSHPLGAHSSIKNTRQSADAGLANDIITAVKNLDKNDGEIIFNEDRDDVIVTKNSVVSHTEQKNYYKEELLAKREEERKTKEAQETIEQARQEKISDKEKNEIRTIIFGIKKKIDYLETTKESYENLYSSAMQLIETELASLDQTETLEQDKENIRKTIEAQLEFSTDDKIKEINKIIEENNYSDTDSKETLQAKSDRLKEKITDVDKEYEEYDEWVSQIIVENPHISHLQEKYKGIIAIETLIRNLQIDRRTFKEMTKETGTEKKYEDVSKSLSQKKKALLELKTAFINNEISIEDAKIIAKNISNSAETEFIEFLDAHKTDEEIVAAQKDDPKVDRETGNLISEIESKIAQKQSRLDDVYKLLEKIKPNCEESKYQELKSKADAISSKIKNGKMQKILEKLQNATLSPYMRTKRVNTVNDEYNSITKLLYKLSGEIIELLPEEERGNETKYNELDLFAGNADKSSQRSKEEDEVTPDIQTVTEELEETVIPKSKETDTEQNVQTVTEIAEKPAISEQGKIENLDTAERIEEDKAEVPEDIFNILSSKMTGNTPVEETSIPKSESKSDLQTTKTHKKPETVSGKQQQQTSAEVKKSESTVEKPQVKQSEKTQPKQINTETNKPKESHTQIQMTKQAESSKVISNSRNEDEFAQKEISFAQNLVNTTAEIIAMLNIHPLIEDFKSVISGLFTEEDINELKNLPNNKYEEILSAKIRNISGNKHIKEIKRARLFTVLKDIELSNPDTAKEIYKKPVSEINNVVSTIAKTGKYNGYKPEMKDLNAIYTTYNKKPKNIENTAKFIAECFNMNEKGKNNLENLMTENLSYINDVTSDSASTSFKTLIIKTVMSDFDKKYHTNYSAKADTAIQNRANKKSEEEKIKMLYNFDWNSDSLF